MSDALGRAPDIHILPVGNAGNISAYWMGYREYREAGVNESLPQMWGFQAAGAAPFVAGHPISDPETVATAIRIGAPASWHLAVEARATPAVSSTRSPISRSDAQKLLAAEVGTSQPASAAGVAGLLQQSSGLVPAGATIAITVTGNGLKDIDTAMTQHDSPHRGAGGHRCRRRPSACEDPEHHGLGAGPDFREPRLADALGLALDLCDELSVEATTGAVEIEVEGGAPATS